MNVSEVYRVMCDAVSVGYRRKSGDESSPCQVDTLEAQPGLQFVLDDMRTNVPEGRSCNLTWAYANLLHFFAGTEEAVPLRRYNRHAERFVTDGMWIGAYGAVAMPQVEECCDLLTDSPGSRRAIVSMGGPTPSDVNRPACWSFLHFLRSRGRLDLLVYQRSLNVALMPYDCVLLTNLLEYVAAETEMQPGALRWTVGSLHRKVDEPSDVPGSEQSVRLSDYDPIACWYELGNPTHPWLANEVRS